MSNLNLLEVTTLLKNNGINTTARKLKVKKTEIYNFLKNNGLKYTNGEVKTLIDDIIETTNIIQFDKIRNIESRESIIQKKSTKNIELDKIKELIDLIEPLKEIVQEYEKHKQKNN